LMGFGRNKTFELVNTRHRGFCVHLVLAYTNTKNTLKMPV